MSRVRRLPSRRPPRVGFVAPEFSLPGWPDLFNTRRGIINNRKIQAIKLQKLLLIPIVCLALLPKAQAVVSPPDVGYPGANTAEGQNALLSQTTGEYNAAIGWLSLRGLTTGSFNAGVVGGTLALNNADVSNLKCVYSSLPAVVTVVAMMTVVTPMPTTYSLGRNKMNIDSRAPQNFTVAKIESSCA